MSQALQETEKEELARLRDFFDQATIGLHLVGSDGTILRANRADYESLGYTHDEYVGHNIAEFHVDEDVINDILTRLSSGEELVEYPARLRAKDGSIRDVLINSSVNFIDGEFVNTRCLTRDVTESRRAERALRSEEERYGTLTRLLPALVVTTNPEGNIEDISDSYKEYSGLSLEQSRDWKRHPVVHPEDFRRAMERWRDSLATGEPLQHEMRLRRHDGVYRWFLAEAAPVRNEFCHIDRWMAVIIDIDERKREEERARYLAEATERLVAPLDSPELLANIARLAVPALSDICAIGLFDGTSETARIETAGASTDEAPHVAHIHLRGWRAAPGSKETIGDKISAGIPVIVERFDENWIHACAPTEEQRQAATSVRAISLICVPLVARGECIGMATFATTQRSGRIYSEKDGALLVEVAARLSISIENGHLIVDLRKANAAKDEFLGLVSHELRTPLTVIRGNAHVLSRSTAAVSANDRQTAMDDIVRESERLQAIIDNLLVLARLDQGQALQLEPIIVRRVIERVVSSKRLTNTSREFRVTAIGSAEPVNFAEGYLDQIIENFISNAQKYSPPTEPIEIVIQRDDDELTVRVLDRGIGITAEEGTALFEPFYRSDNVHPTVAGLGIGLTVCKRLIEAQGGRIWANPREGGGSEFGFAMPVVRDE